MEKIKLKNEEVFEIVPMGIETDLYNKTRTFSFISELGYAEIETAFTTQNLSKIEYLSSTDELLKTYIDCVVLKSLTKEFGKEVEDGVIADVYSVDLELD